MSSQALKCCQTKKAIDGPLCADGLALCFARVKYTDKGTFNICPKGRGVLREGIIFIALSSLSQRHDHNMIIGITKGSSVS